MSGTDVAEETTEETVGEGGETKKKGLSFRFLRIWLPFPVVLGAMLFLQFRSGKLTKPDPDVAVMEQGVFEGAGAELPVLLQALQDERGKLQRQWEELRFEERRVLIEQSEIEERKKDVEALLARVDAKVEVMEEERDQMLAQLARVYETMKPDAAAEILSGIEVDTSTEILRRMKERSAAQVMASLEPKSAARISQRMLRQP
jgi:flagellar motility protein MotE (MotC chaperone)